MAAKVPDDIALAVYSSLIGTQVSFSWRIPSNGGSPITSYLVEFQVKNTTFTTTSSWVPIDGSISGIKSWQIAMSSFLSSPFNLVLNDLIVVRVTASNILGSAKNSSPINTSGVTVQTVPKMPPTVPTIGSATTDTQIEVLISALTGDYTGQSLITTYDIYWDHGTNMVDWALIKSVTDNGGSTISYIQTSSVSKGITYYFKYRGNNIYGSGTFSNYGGILAADVPGKVSQPTLMRSGTNVIISWPIPDSKGSVILMYKVMFKNQTSSTYQEVSSMWGLSTSNPITSTSWTVKMSSFITQLGYTIGQSLLVEVAAYNIKGWGLPSDELTQNF